MMNGSNNSSTLIVKNLHLDGSAHAHTNTHTHTFNGPLSGTDDLAVIAETEEQLIKRLNEWKENVESKGMRVTHTRLTALIPGLPR